MAMNLEKETDMPRTNGLGTKVLRLGALTLVFIAAACGGSTPPPSADISGLVVAGTPPGACLVEYNTALATGDPCCFAEGGANTCDLATKCNAASGAECCLFYATNNTVLGSSACCRYEGTTQPRAADGSDITSERNALLQAGR
jgi:hypothetical protein